MAAIMLKLYFEMAAMMKTSNFSEKIEEEITEDESRARMDSSTSTTSKK